MADEISAGCPTGRLYSQSLSIALVSFLACRYCRNGGSVGEPPHSGLPHRDTQQILDYIDDNLGSNLTLGVLAGLVDLSPQHFCHAFHEAVGLTPHQYVIRRRIEKAKRLLDENRLRIVDVALNLGFSNQSHFTDLFRRVTGKTPKNYQRNI
nr:AraC family transcriptional regulator [Methylonatrum kenyense]